MTPNEYPWVEGRLKCLVMRILVEQGIRPSMYRLGRCEATQEEGELAASLVKDSTIAHWRNVGPKTLALFRERYGPYRVGNAMRAYDV